MSEVTVDLSIGIKFPGIAMNMNSERIARSKDQLHSIRKEIP